MRVHRIPDLESRFYKTLRDASGKTFKLGTGTFPYVRRLVLPNPKHFIAQKRTKNKIILHFTAGVLTGDISALTTNSVSTAYVLARDGTIYELFNPEFCAYHIGPSRDGSYSNKDMSFTSIGIEISNIGPLKLAGDALVDIYGKDYCGIDEPQFYDSVSYRGYDYYASYTAEQYSSLDQLLTDLCARYDIPRRGFAPPERFMYAPKSAPRAPISCHVNWRKDKYDLAPNFRFNNIGL